MSSGSFKKPSKPPGASKTPGAPPDGPKNRSTPSDGFRAADPFRQFSHGGHSFQQLPRGRDLVW